MNSSMLVVLILLSSLSTIFAQVCGDGVCASGETPSTCPDDCGLCGNGVCDFLQYEDRHYCPVDCSLYLETFVFGNDYVTWIPASATGEILVDTDQTNYLSVTFPARAANSFGGYFNIYNSDWANIVNPTYRNGFFYYILAIESQFAVADPTYPDFIIYDAATGGFLYYYFSTSDYATLNDGNWHSVSIDLVASDWYYAVADAQGFVDFTTRVVSTDAIWNSFNGSVSAIYIKGQFANTGGAIGDLSAFQLAPAGVTGICTPACASNSPCGSNGCGGSCGTCSFGQSCQSGTCVTVTGPVTTGTTAQPFSTGTSGSTAVFTTGTSAQPFSTGTSGTTAVFTTGTSAQPFSTGTSGSTAVFTTGTSAQPFSTGTSGSTAVFTTGTSAQPFSTGTSGSTAVFTTGTSAQPFSTGTSGSTAVFTTGTTAQPFSTGTSGTTAAFSTGTSGTTGIHSTGTTGTTGIHTTGTTGTLCGNGICAGSENPSNCPEDCGTCGDHYCDPNTEDSRLCPEDCGTCGNGVCEASKGENSVTCEVDCGASVCGDGYCTAGESTQTCPADCVAPQPNTVQITLNFAGLIPAQDCCSCCSGKK